MRALSPVADVGGGISVDGPQQSASSTFPLTISASTSRDVESEQQNQDAVPMDRQDGDEGQTKGHEARQNRKTSGRSVPPALLRYFHLRAGNGEEDGDDSGEVQDTGELETEQRQDTLVVCEWTDGGVVNDTALCPALFEGNLTGPPATRLTYCEGEGEVDAVFYRVPAQRRQALLVVQSLDGLWRKAVFQPVSDACGNCAECLSVGGRTATESGENTDSPSNEDEENTDAAPTCAASGCSGCPVSGQLSITASMLPKTAAAGSVFEVLLLCSLRGDAGGGGGDEGGEKQPFTQIVVTLRVEGKRDACGVCGG